MTEETNMSSEEQESQETLDSTEEKKAPAESEQMVPVTKHVADRHKFQERIHQADIENANLRGQLTTLQGQVTAPVVKSPMELAMAAEGVDNPDDLEKPFAVFQAQQAFEKEQTADATAASTRQARSEAQLSSRELSMVEHPDWQTVVNAAIKHMTKGEMLDLESEGENFGEKIYVKSQQVLERVKPVKNTAPETELSKLEAEAKVKADAEAKAKADAEKVPSQDEVLKSDNPRIDHVMNL